MKQFINDHFAVIVVLVVFIMMFSAYILEVKYHENAGIIDWLEGELKEVIGALLMGLTGSRLAQSISQGGTDATPKVDTPTPNPGATLPTYPKS